MYQGLVISVASAAEHYNMRCKYNWTGNPHGVWFKSNLLCALFLCIQRTTRVEVVTEISRNCTFPWSSLIKNRVNVLWHKHKIKVLQGKVYMFMYCNYSFHQLSEFHVFLTVVCTITRPFQQLPPNVFSCKEATRSLIHHTLMPEQLTILHLQGWLCFYIFFFLFP